MNDLFGPSLEASLEDLKSIYRILVDQFDAHPELEANTFLEALRNLLEDQAEAEGVDIDDDDAWDAWLHEPPLPEVAEPPTELLN